MSSVVVPAGAPSGRAGRVVAAFLALLPIAFVIGLAVSAASVGGRPSLIVGAGWTDGRALEVLEDWGLPAGWLAGYWALLELVVVAVTVAAAVVVLRAPRSAFRIYLAGVLLLHAAAGGAVLPVLGALYPQLVLTGTLVQGLAWFALFPLAYVFPDGRFVPHWTRWLPVGWLALFVALLLGPAEPPATPWLVLPMLALLASCLFAQGYRYIRASSAVQRRQIRWVVFAVGLRFAYMVAILATPLGALMSEQSSRGLAINLGLTTVSYLVSAMLPAAIAIAVVRHRLFDIDLVISRTLVYGTLTVCVAGSYAAIVAAAGALWPAGDAAIAIVAAAVVALVISPLRSWLQKRVNRLVYGQRDDPYAVVSGLGQRLQATAPLDTVLQTIADTIGTALKVPYVAVTGSAGTAEYGADPTGRTTAFPLLFQGNPIGEIQVATAPGDQLGPADRALLTELGQHAGVAVQAASLLGQVQAARERIAAAREEERRRLHRDLHDGLGPTLASLYQRVDTAATVLARDPERAALLLTGVGEEIKTTIGDIRDLVYALRPPALDDLGLVAAIETAARRLDRMSFTVTGELPPLPAIVEVAAYRIAAEAMTNAVRHSAGTTCDVKFSLRSQALIVEVIDNGSWLPGTTGAGLRSMRERAEETGGSLSAGPGPNGGTHITARLPLSVDTSWE